MITSSSSCSNTYWTRLQRRAVGGGHIRLNMETFLQWNFPHGVPLYPLSHKPAEQTVRRKRSPDRSFSFPVSPLTQKISPKINRKQHGVVALLSTVTLKGCSQNLLRREFPVVLEVRPPPSLLPPQLQPPGSLHSGDWRSSGQVLQPSRTRSSSQDIL